MQGWPSEMQKLRSAVVRGSTWKTFLHLGWSTPDIGRAKQKNSKLVKQQNRRADMQGWPSEMQKRFFASRAWSEKVKQ